MFVRSPSGLRCLAILSQFSIAVGATQDRTPRCQPTTLTRKGVALRQQRGSADF